MIKNQYRRASVNDLRAFNLSLSGLAWGHVEFPPRWHVTWVSARSPCFRVDGLTGCARGSFGDLARVCDLCDSAERLR